MNNRETEEGWGEEIQGTLCDVFDSLEKLMYEVRNCVRGGYTHCKTNAELAEHIRSLASDLEAAAEEIE